MFKKHVIKNLSAYYHDELPAEDAHRIASHLDGCTRCRAEFEEIKLGATLAKLLPQCSAPESLWNDIETALDKQDGKNKLSGSIIPAQAFGWHRFAAVTAMLLLVIGLGLAWYFMRRPQTTEQIAGHQTAQPGQVPQQTIPQKDVEPVKNDTRETLKPGAEIVEKQPVKDAVFPPAVKSPGDSKPVKSNPNLNSSLPAWQVARLAGAPKVGADSITDTGRLAVGEWLETDAASRAKIEVANIGQVEIEPNSRVRLVTTRATEHRLELARGRMQAQIDAPPRLFIVDTPSAVAVDLGCAYTLEVDDAGRSILHVTSGWVALERKGRESIVPAGAVCVTQPGIGLGTPYFADSAPALREALARFDFQNGGTASLNTILAEAESYDALTLWHLLSRVNINERGRVYDALADYIAPPAGVTRAGVLRLNKKMLSLWKEELINSWFE